LSDDVVPGLKYLLKDCQGTDVDTVKQLLKDVETKIEEHQRPMSRLLIKVIIVNYFIV
jgi:hypothetical protein